MGGQILVADLEPVRAAELLDIFQCLESFRLPAPAGFGVCQSGKRVANGIQIGADGEAQVLKIVAGVDNNGQIIGGK